MTPKYALIEIERRWLVDADQLPDLSEVPVSEIEDRYISVNLRVRKVTRVGAVTYKMTRKYEFLSPLSRPITNLYLAEEEYHSLMQLPGTNIHKRRYHIEGGALDVGDCYLVFEHEFSTQEEAASYVPPAFAGQEL
ncbi:MAG: hypothetical protein JNJ45_06675 [Chthonomonas sp.]|nr:hypothetical protein [Chthonomonas sp.]